MKIVLQRVAQAHVDIDNACVGRIEKGYVLLLGLEEGDHARLIEPVVDKILKIKLFSDENGRFAHSIQEISGKLLVISQFTLFADLKKGKKPSLSKALDPDRAKQLYEQFLEELQNRQIPVETGEFGAAMQVHIQNDGPVTIILNSRELFPSLHQ